MNGLFIFSDYCLKIVKASGKVVCDSIIGAIRIKKYILLFGLIIIPAAQIFAVTYYVSFIKGNDQNNGTLPATPWKTMYKVSNTKFKPGDSVLFNRGENWRGQLIPVSGDPSGYITYSSYGKLNASKPLILGSVNGNNPENWKNSTGNIWENVINKSISNAGSDSPLNADVGNIIFNDGGICAVKVWSESELDIQGEFWYDAEHKVVKIYSVGNPAHFYKNIELALKGHIIDQTNKSYVRYESLDLRYGASHGIGGGNVHHIIILNCDISFIGGALHTYSKSGKPVRFGNGIEFWADAHDCYVIGCKLRDIYDAALTNQGQDNVAQYNIFYWNNIIWNSEYSFEYWLRSNSKASHIYFENNTCVYAGNGWGHNQRPDGHNGRHLMFYDNQAEVDNFYIRNNIFSESTESDVRLSARWVDLSDLSLDHNLYFESSGEIADWQGTHYLFQDYKVYQKGSGKDLSSVFSDPCFVDISKFDFHLRHDSPAINSGMDTENSGNSLRNVQKAGSKSDIGAIESPY
jgi:hypothetical protein